MLVTPGADTQHVRGESHVSRPVRRVVRVAGVCRDQQGDHCCRDEVLPRGGVIRFRMTAWTSRWSWKPSGWRRTREKAIMAPTASDNASESPAAIVRPTKPA